MLETELDQMLCLIDDTAFIESDTHFKTNFAQISLVLQHCIENKSKDPSDCASEAEARAFWDSYDYAILQVGHEQIDMKN